MLRLHGVFHTFLCSCSLHDSYHVPPLFGEMYLHRWNHERHLLDASATESLTQLAHFERAHPHAALVGCKSLWVEYVGRAGEKQNLTERSGERQSSY